MVLQHLADAGFNRVMSKSMAVEYPCGGIASIIQDGEQQVLRFNQQAVHILRFQKGYPYAFFRFPA